MSNNEVKELNISKDALYKVKIESKEEMKKSIFKDEYEKAYMQFEEIINSQNIEDEEDEINNIIAFIGERGAGKSSAMLSFRNSIKAEKDKLKNIKYHTLHSIDPSIMTKNDSIIEIIVGQMFKKFKDNRNSKKYIKEHELISCFENVFNDLKFLNPPFKYSNSSNPDNLEELMGFSSAISLRKNFKELVCKFLTYISKDDDAEKNFLIITIDDLDLNISSAQTMLEDIRRYLLQTNIIILMAIKIEQLEDVLIQKNVNDLEGYQKNYIIPINDKNLKDAFFNEIRNKAIKYLEKILPYNRRIVLPKVDMDKVKVLFKDGFENLTSYEDEVLKYTVVKIFFGKYRYIIESESHLKEIMPTTLRGWQQLFAFLNIGENKEEKPEDPTLEKQPNYFANIQNLKNYYENHISNEINTLVGKEYLLECLHCPIEELNRRVFLFLNDFVNEFMRNNEINEKGDKDNVLKIFDDVKELNRRKRFIAKENISMGHVVSWIKFYENSMYYKEEIKIIELIKLILSLRYLEMYFKEPDKLVNVIGRDFVGRYFELVRNKHMNSNGNRFDAEAIKRSKSIKSIVFKNPEFNKLTDSNKELFSSKDGKEYSIKNSELKNKISDLCKSDDDISLEQIKKIDSLLEMYFTLIEPDYQDQWKTRNSLFYRNGFSLNQDWTSKDDLIKYSLKPMNIIGYKYLSYNKFNTNKEKNREEILLIINIDFFMTLLIEFNKTMNNLRISMPVDFIYKVIESFNPKLAEKAEKIGITHDDISLSEDEKWFLEKNISYSVFKEIKGYSLEYDDEGKYFLYYNYKNLGEIKEHIKSLDIENFESDEDEDKKNKLSYIYEQGMLVEEQFKIIINRIKTELNSENKKKCVKMQTTITNNMNNVLPKSQLTIEQIVSRIEEYIDATCEIIDDSTEYLEV